MSQCLFIHDFFQDGYLDTISEVRLLQEIGQWTSERRASWLVQAITSREQLSHTRPDCPQVRAYYAGRIAALKSKVTAQFSKQPASFEKKSEYASLMSYVQAHQQERYREATVYTHADGWDWEEDEQESLERERMLLVPTRALVRFTFQFAVRWLCIGTLFILLLSPVPVYLIPCLVLSSAAFALTSLEGGERV